MAGVADMWTATTFHSGWVHLLPGPLDCYLHRDACWVSITSRSVQVPLDGEGAAPPICQCSLCGSATYLDEVISSIGIMQTGLHTYGQLTFTFNKCCFLTLPTLNGSVMCSLAKAMQLQIAVTIEVFCIHV